MTALRVLPLLALVSVGADPTPFPADVTMWVEVPVPKGAEALRRLRDNAIGSPYTWVVAADAGRVVVTRKGRGDFIGRKPGFPLDVKDVPLDLRDMAKSAVKVDDGWLVAYGAGEWGEAFWWFSPDGKRNRKVSNHYIEQLVRWQDGAFALEGLDHVTSKGNVVRLVREGGAWAVKPFAKLPDVGYAAAVLPDGSLFVVAGSRLLRVSSGGAVDTLLAGTDWLVAPNSAAVAPGGQVYIGARQFVAVYDPQAKGPALRLLVPGKDILRPEK